MIHHNNESNVSSQYLVYILWFSTFVAEIVSATATIAGWAGRARGPVLVWRMSPPVTSVKRMPHDKS